ncbi:hypothetical protein [Synechococcus phage S-H34]|uniref:Uncharacterized protein n=1 Tax=Synechococcus phage S-H34 TaxID=2718942 RepID=A0A6G8R6A9_9CAUD|nr:hypothetical protein PQC15_gp078 [Synechococcus phage S-H34]QIN96949.1 hypothetical protein [Synechococcus phage S-H34]
MLLEYTHVVYNLLLTLNSTSYFFTIQLLHNTKRCYTDSYK